MSNTRRGWVTTVDDSALRVLCTPNGKRQHEERVINIDCLSSHIQEKLPPFVK